MTRAPETGAINRTRLHFLAPVFEPYASGMKIFGAENKRGWKRRRGWIRDW